MLRRIKNSPCSAPKIEVTCTRLSQQDITIARGRFALATAAAKLPEGAYRLVTDLPARDIEEIALAWLLAAYRYDRYKDQGALKAQLVAPDGIDAAKLESIAAGEALTRDLINTPAADMGPAELETAFLDLATTHGAEAKVITGDDLLTQDFPLIHTCLLYTSPSPRDS